MTLGSLFDGIGGFCLAGQYAGMQPIWSSEIEPFPIRVTEKRFPDVMQLGDVHALRGDAIPPVDVITFGSPCQNLSIAGRRAGLQGEQSSLFFEAVRIITEMRNATNGQYPKWAVWENVPGALSSNDGHDFQSVLQSLIRIKDGSANVPMPENGKWHGAGEIMGDDYSLAWRILDAAKGWGVAQRRRRIFAVVHFDGLCAGKVLFESEGMSGYSPPCPQAWEGTADSAEAGIGAAGVPVEYHQQDDRIRIKEDGICPTLTALCGTGGNNVPLTLKIRSGCAGGGKGALIQTNVSATLGCNNDQTLFEPIVYGISADKSNAMLSENPHSGIYEAETSRTLDCNGGNPCCNQGGIAVVQSYALQGNMIGRKDENGPQGDGVNEEVSFTLNTIDRHAVCAMSVGFFHASEEQAPALLARDYKDPHIVCDNVEYCVRRLTPDECCRLQGYPDGWCRNLASDHPSDEEIPRWTGILAQWDAIQGRKRSRTRKQVIKWLQNPHSDSAEYKAYGNSVAVPCVFFVLAGIVWCEEQEAK